MNGTMQPGGSRKAPQVHPFLSPDGEIGRRSGLKIRREQSHGGSSPPPGTTYMFD